ncbi:hypothetical protein Cfor_01459 [Coptotermes formosanus]|jgi:hypothetical protein|uniref:Reverse transcriptase domain-containing protein n=1 Tax=Coptotermes formosanus TaxID=36987 RepID=A0A6L2Q8C9_COPFO|nr:hypothetical protein Cfor_01459 [Coptotermes formosanus]
MPWSRNECGKNCGNKNLKAKIPNIFYDRSKAIGKYGIFQIFGSTITNDASFTREIKDRITMAKTAFSKKKATFTSQMDLNLRKKLVKCYIWSIALYGAETWALLKVAQQYLESVEMWCWRKMKKVRCTDHVR